MGFTDDIRRYLDIKDCFVESDVETRFLHSISGHSLLFDFSSGVAAQIVDPVGTQAAESGAGGGQKGIRYVSEQG